VAGEAGGVNLCALATFPVRGMPSAVADVLNPDKSGQVLLDNMRMHPLGKDFYLPFTPLDNSINQFDKVKQYPTGRGHLPR